MVKNYNTGNPVPSGNPKDFSDNSITIDDFVNGDKECVYNRVGKSILTLFGIDLMVKKRIGDFNEEIDRIIKEAGGIEVASSFGGSKEKAISQYFFSSVGSTIYVKDYIDGGIEESLRKIFERANITKETVSFAGIDDIEIEANANIKVNTSVDFCGCNFLVKNGFSDDPGWYKHNVLFHVESEKKLIEVEAKIEDSYLLIEDGKSGYALMESDFKVADRYKSKLTNYIQSFNVVVGRSTTAINADHSNVNLVSVLFRENDRQRIEIKNFRFDRSLFNNQIMLKISRNCTDLFGISDGEEEYTESKDISSPIYLDNVSDISLNNIKITPRTSDGSDEGSTGRGYSLHFEGAASINMNNISGSGGGATIASNNINGVSLNNSYVDRFDCHSSGHNMSAEDTIFNDRAIGIGWGGGDITINRCKLRTTGSAFITDRPDYDGSFYNCKMSVKNSTLYTNKNRSRAFVWLASWGANGGSGTGNLLKDTILPDIIEVEDCTVRDSNTLVGNNVTMGVWVRVKSNTKVKAPSFVKIVNIYNNTSQRSRSGNLIQVEGMYGDCHINIENFMSESAEFNQYTSRGYLLNTNTDVEENKPLGRIFLNVDKCRFVAIKTACEGGYIRVNNSTIQCLRTKMMRSDSVKNTISVYNSEFTYPILDSDETHSLIGYADKLGGTYVSTSLFNCKILGNFEIRYVDVAQGCVVNGLVKIPSGLTASNLFLGYKSNNFQ